MSKWFVCDILDDGHWGIVNAENEIVLGASSPLTGEQAMKIVETHNKDLTADDKEEK